MIDRILTVGGITLLSRVTGFLRDIMLAAVLGAGPVADAFFVARGCRTISVRSSPRARSMPPSCRPMRASAAPMARRGALFTDRIFTLLLASQVVLLAVALALHAAGDRSLWRRGSARIRARFALAVDLTRITFPVSVAGQPGHAVRRHPQRARPLRRRRRRANPAQLVNDDDAWRSRRFSRPPATPRRGACCSPGSGVAGGRRRRATGCAAASFWPRSTTR